METVCRAYNGLLMWRTTLLCIIISRGVDMLRYLFMTLNLIIMTMMRTNGYVKCSVQPCLQGSRTSPTDTMDGTPSVAIARI